MAVSHAATTIIINRPRGRKGQKKMNEKMRDLCKIVGANPELMQHGRMTTDEILECILCYVGDDGEIVDRETGNATGIWYEELV